LDDEAPYCRDGNRFGGLRPATFNEHDKYHGTEVDEQQGKGIELVWAERCMKKGDKIAQGLI
jgi:hypothetical protein